MKYFNINFQYFKPQCCEQESLFFFPSQLPLHPYQSYTYNSFYGPFPQECTAQVTCWDSAQGWDWSLRHIFVLIKTKSKSSGVTNSKNSTPRSKLWASGSICCQKDGREKGTSSYSQKKNNRHNQRLLFYLTNPLTLLLKDRQNRDCFIVETLTGLTCAALYQITTDMCLGPIR